MINKHSLLKDSNNIISDGKRNIEGMCKEQKNKKISKQKKEREEKSASKGKEELKKVVERAKEQHENLIAMHKRTCKESSEEIKIERGKASLQAQKILEKRMMQ